MEKEPSLSPVAPAPGPLHLAPRVSNSDELDSPALEVYLKGKSARKQCDEPDIGFSHPGDPGPFLCMATLFRLVGKTHWRCVAQTHLLSGPLCFSETGFSISWPLISHTPIPAS